MDKIKSLTILVILCCTLPASGLTLVYVEESSSDRVEHTFTFEENVDGYLIVVSSVKAGSPVITQALETDKGFSVLSWRYQDREAGTDITGIRRKSHISLSGRYRRRALERSFEVDSKPWYQLFPHGLEQMVVSRQQETLFYAIGVEGIGTMRIGTFRAQRGKVEKIEWKGRPEHAVHVHISLTGFASIFWSGVYWHRPGDGRNLVSKSDRGPGTQPIVVELNSER